MSSIDLLGGHADFVLLLTLVWGEVREGVVGVSEVPCRVRGRRRQRIDVTQVPAVMGSHHVRVCVIGRVRHPLRGSLHSA
jgi:hypothetical protein